MNLEFDFSSSTARRLPSTQKCKVPACDREARVHGWCKPHYRRYWRNPLKADLCTPVSSYLPKQCSVSKCVRPAICKGLCNPHYIRARHGKPLAGRINLRGDVTIGRVAKSAEERTSVLASVRDTTLLSECGRGKQN